MILILGHEYFIIYNKNDQSSLYLINQSHFLNKMQLMCYIVRCLDSVKIMYRNKYFQLHKRIKLLYNSFKHIQHGGYTSAVDGSICKGVI